MKVFNGSIDAPLDPWTIKRGDIITLDDGKGASVTGPVVVTIIPAGGGAQPAEEFLTTYRGFDGYLVKLVRP